MTSSDDHICQECGYYRQHYIWNYGYGEINRGHCVHPPRVRSCRPGMEACADWVPQTEEYRKRYYPPEGEGLRKLDFPKMRRTKAP